MPWWPGKRRRRAASVDGVPGTCRRCHLRSAREPLSLPPQLEPRPRQSELPLSAWEDVRRQSDGPKFRGDRKPLVPVRDRCPPSRGARLGPGATYALRASPVLDGWRLLLCIRAGRWSADDGLGRLHRGVRDRLGTPGSKRLRVRRRSNTDCNRVGFGSEVVKCCSSGFATCLSRRASSSFRLGSSASRLASTLHRGRVGPR